MTRSKDFLTRLWSGDMFVADGATGTMLQEMGLEAGTAPEIWILEQPDRIRALHQAYVEAGVDLILTCTFGGSRFRLASHDLADRVIEINRRAAQLARQVAASASPSNGTRTIFVGGDMGPTGHLLKPLGDISHDEVTAAYAEQATGLAEGGADLLIIETMSDLGEALAAIDGARRATDLPIICTFSFDTHGRTMMGLKPETVAQEIWPRVEGVGANCGRDPAEYIDLVHAMRQAAPEAILWAKPNAGLPHLVDDHVEYDATPETMSQIAPHLRDSGAQVIGGCCGTTPAHLAAMAAALRGQRPVAAEKEEE
jgi:5-methyltetrahydrofolate--homocysteine methyltransferase